RDFHVTGVQTCALPIMIQEGRVRQWHSQSRQELAKSKVSLSQSRITMRLSLTRAKQSARSSASMQTVRLIGKHTWLCIRSTVKLSARWGANMMLADLLIYFAGLLIMIVLLVPTSHDDDLASDAGDSEESYPLLQSVFVEGSQFDY